jgi:hypothetical protein
LLKQGFHEQTIGPSSWRRGSNAAILHAPDRSSLTLKGTFPNTGVVQLNSTGSATDLFISGNVTLSGKGDVTLSNNSNNLIQGASTGTEVLTNSSTIQAAGNIGNGFMGVVNKGTILANQTPSSTPTAPDSTTPARWW